jgi:hypothetical protein
VQVIADDHETVLQEGDFFRLVLAGRVDFVDCPKRDNQWLVRGEWNKVHRKNLFIG